MGARRVGGEAPVRRQKRRGKTSGVIRNEKACSALLRRLTRVTAALDDPEEEKSSPSPCLTTLCQKTLPAPCLTTPRRHRRLSRGISLLPAVEHHPLPCSTTSCRQSPSEGMLDGILPENTVCRWCSTASSGCYSEHRSLARVLKNRRRLCLTTFRRQAHNGLVLGDHMQPCHGRD